MRYFSTDNGCDSVLFFGYIRPLSSKVSNQIFHSYNDEELRKSKILSRFRLRVSIGGSTDTRCPTTRTKHAAKGTKILEICLKKSSVPTVSMLSNFLAQPSLPHGNITIEVGSIGFYPLLNIRDSRRQRVRKSLSGIQRIPIPTKRDGSRSKFQRSRQISCRDCTLCAVPETRK